MISTRQIIPLWNQRLIRQSIAILVMVALVGCATIEYEEPVRRVIMIRPYSYLPQPQYDKDFDRKKSLSNRSDPHHGFTVAPPLKRMVVTSPFGDRRTASIGGGGTRYHRGVDLRASMGTPVFAPRDGIVRAVYTSSSYGLVVELDHGSGWASLFAHLSKAKVRRGQRVREGEVVALTGATGRVTGPHLHWELRHEGRALDPQRFLFR